MDLPNLSCNVANKKQPNPQNRLEHWRNGQSRFRGVRCPAGKKTRTAIIIIPRKLCGVTNPPVTPPPLTPARPPVDSQQETGQDGRTREKGGGGPGGLRVGRPSFPTLTYERKTQDARGSKEKNSPPPTRETRGNHRENTARGTHPPRGSETPLGTEKTKKNRQNRLGKHLLEYSMPSQSEVVRDRRSRLERKSRRKKQQKKENNSSPVVSQSS